MFDINVDSEDKCLMSVNQDGLQVNFDGDTQTITFDNFGGLHKLNNGQWKPIVITWDYEKGHIEVWNRHLKLGSLTNYKTNFKLPQL